MSDLMGPAGTLNEEATFDLLHFMLSDNWTYVLIHLQH